MKLHENETDFKDAIQAAANHFKIRDVFVEKDYWVTYALKNLSMSKYFDKVVFKGGTSISKAYGIAKRFSEDIDLAIIQGDDDAATLENLIEAVEVAVATAPFEKQKGGFFSKNRKFKQSHWGYPKKTTEKHDPAKEKIMLEITSSAKTSPNNEMKIQTLVAEFFEKTNKPNEISEFKLQSFKVKVLCHKRTFAEKIVAIANASLKNDNLKTLKEKIRHLYDLTILIDDSEVKKFISSSNFTNMVDEARDGDKAIPELKEVAEKPWRSAEIFQKPDAVLLKLEETYKNELGPFIFNEAEMPKLKDIEKMLKYVVEKAP